MTTQTTLAPPTSSASQRVDEGVPSDIHENLWRVSDIPNWGERWVDEIDYASIDHDHFFKTYADHWRPVVLRGACHEWPAYKKWDNKYLDETWGDAAVDIYTAPNPQGGHKATLATSIKARIKGTLADLIATKEKNWSVRAFTLGTGTSLDSMSSDLADHWLDKKPAPLMYPRRRLFIHRGGVSLWHAHPTDDHLTFQIRGAKDFVFLPPEQTKLIHRMNKNELYSFNVDPERYPEWRKIKPLCARVQAGDAVFIPPGWWHTVVPVDQELGVTLASTWASSRRAMLKHGIPSMFYQGNRSYLPFLPFVLLYALTGWRSIVSRSNPAFR
jgi:hypothetical protein